MDLVVGDFQAQNVENIQQLMEKLPVPIKEVPKYERFTHRDKPISTKRYFIQNVGREQWLNLANFYVTEGNQVLAWKKSTPESENETWRITEYEEGHYFIESRTVLLRGVGGYVGLKDKKTVNTQTPFLWKFEEITGNSRVYQMKPVHPDFATEALASVHDDGFKDWTQAQAGLVPDNREDDKQQWIFIEAPVTPYGCTEPISGRNYYVFNVGRERWLDLAESKTNDGNFVLAWYKNSMPTANQIWNFTELSGSCTLQNLAALKERDIVGGNEGGLGGHLHVDTVIGAGPFAWELEAVGGALYKIHPKDRPETSLTCVTDRVNSIPDGAAKLEHTRAKDDAQLWAFIPAIELV